MRLRTDIFYQSRLCRAPNSEKVKMALSLELWRILWWNFAYKLILTRCSQWDWQMIFGIGRDFAEVQILKKVKLAYSLNLLVYFNKILHTHFYWHDLDRGIAKSNPKWHLTSVEAVPSSRFCKIENGRIEWTIVMKLCLHIDIDKM